MGSKGRTLWAALAAVVAVAVTGTAAQAAGLDVLWLKSGNHTSSARKISSVDRIVIHVTEGSFWGAVTWLRNPRSHGSSHYVISRGGDGWLPSPPGTFARRTSARASRPGRSSSW